MVGCGRGQRFLDIAGAAALACAPFGGGRLAEAAGPLQWPGSDRFSTCASVESSEYFATSMESDTRPVAGRDQTRPASITDLCGVFNIAPRVNLGLRIPTKTTICNFISHSDDPEASSPWGPIFKWTHPSLDHQFVWLVGLAGSLLALYLSGRVLWPVPHSNSRPIVNNTMEAFDHERQRIVLWLIPRSYLPRSRSLSHETAVPSPSLKKVTSGPPHECVDQRQSSVTGRS